MAKLENKACQNSVCKLLRRKKNKDILTLARKDLIQHWMSLYVDQYSISPYRPHITKKTKENKYILCFSDFQENGENWTMKHFYKIIDFVTHKVKTLKIKELVLIDGGDGIDGMLRVADLVNNRSLAVQQAIIYQKGLIFLILTLSKLVNLTFYSVLSNHTQIRMVGAKRDLMPEDDWAHLWVSTLQILFTKNKRVKIMPAKEEHLFNLNGFKFLLLHGHQLSSLNKIVNYFHYTNSIYKIDYLIHGHYHNFRVTHINAGFKGNKMAISLPAGDPRKNKLYENRLRLSSHPKGLWIKVGSQGLKNLELIDL